MITSSEYPFWISIAHLPRWRTEKINRLIVLLLHEKKISLQEFFSMDKTGWGDIYPFDAKELEDLTQAKLNLPQTTFIAEQLQNEGFSIIPINSPDYPSVLKENLKVSQSPSLLYTKGRISMLHEDITAIVGSRKAGPEALTFTDVVARKCVKEQKVIVSGFAKGVDKQALESTLKANGKSIIVLPQGILTFGTGFKQYYEQIINGEVLVLSTFFPKAGWEVGLAMARNVYIYGLAREIYVAESEEKGGTWQGATNGLKRNRTVYIRHPEPHEKNANLKLISLGAVPVDANGEVINQPMDIPPRKEKPESESTPKPGTSQDSLF